ncbi:MAG: lactonase family protein [Dehalococcoidales bacterium]
MKCHLYVSLLREDKILIFATDLQTGKLQVQGEMKVTGQPANMVFDPGQQFIYVGRKADRSISTYRRNRETGEMSLAGTAPVGIEPDYLASDRKGRFLLSTYISEGRVAVHQIGSDGILRNHPIEWLTTYRGVHSIQIDPCNRFAFIPHIAGNDPNLILQFKFNEVTGHLTPNAPDRVIPEKDAGPRLFCFHPNLDILYFCNQEGSSVTAYQLDTSAGTLSAFQSVSTLPDDYRQKSKTADIQISPSGGFLYVNNRGHDSIACFSVNANNGRLTSIGRVPTEAEARSMCVDPYGNLLFVAGLASGRLVSYRINKDSGELTNLETYAVGNSPWHLLISRPIR